MLPIIPGWTVARLIPPEVKFGLDTHQYIQSGGVIRWAAGTQHAGQIVRHLLPVSSAASASSSGVLPSLAALAQRNAIQPLQYTASAQLATQSILNVANATMAFSGLGLIFNIVSFVVLCQKLDKLDARLAEIGQDVRAIRDMLERKERAALRAALESLSKLGLVENSVTRTNVINGARQTLAEMTVYYAELLAHASDVETAIAAEEFFCVTALAHARCYVETDDMSMADDQLQSAYAQWSTETQRIAKNLLIGDHPERFLYSDFVDESPIESVVSWLDFASGEKIGNKHIDNMRREMSQWHSNGKISVGIKLPRSQKDKRRREREVVIPVLQKFTARRDVWDGYLAQSSAFIAHNVSPRQLERALSQTDEASIIDGYVILEPVQQEPQSEKWRWRR